MEATDMRFQIIRVDKNGFPVFDEVRARAVGRQKAKECRHVMRYAGYNKDVHRPHYSCLRCPATYGTRHSA